MIAVELVEGWTERIPMQLLKDGEPFDLTGLTVEMEAHDKTNGVVSLAGTDGVANPVTGEVYYDPDAADFHASLSPYRIRWKLTDGGGRIAYVPNGVGSVWIVRTV